MERTEPYTPLRLLVPVLADEVGGVYDHPEAFLIQQQHHFPLRAERATSSVSSTLKHLSSANAIGKNSYITQTSKFIVSISSIHYQSLLKWQVESHFPKCSECRMTEVNFCSTPSTWPVLAPHHLLCITRHYEGQEQPARSVFSASGHNLVLHCGYLVLKQNHTKGCNRIH